MPPAGDGQGSAFSRPVATRDLARRRQIDFDIAPDAAARAALAGELDLLKLPKLRFSGTLLPEGAGDWRLEARLGASVVQPCVVTLDPVKTRIDTAVQRRFLAQPPASDPGEQPMPEDDSAEPLAGGIDLGAVLAEALALALPDYPRAAGAELGRLEQPPPGAGEADDTDTARPLARLGRLTGHTKN